ncbi:MAG: aspartate--ammonia ligase [Bacteroidales bacterium]|nr:aspartate--ammonia ligase [Bacteroidales bacterium]
MDRTHIPPFYKSLLDIWQTEQAIKFIKETFQTELSGELKLRRITAPLLVSEGTGLNDNLNGTEEPVRFPLKTLDGKQVEVVQSLAKWKRYALWRHHIEPGMGIYTDMNAIRPDEITDNLHSVYVDQWDWEKVILPEERSEKTLRRCVKSIYYAIKRTQFLLSERFPELPPFLPHDIFFIHAEELRQQYPDLNPKERENKIVKQYGAVFVQGIGGPLGDGSIHDGRSPDYDDWSTETGPGLMGLNGDILVYNPVLDAAMELSSMGIRVNPQSLQHQLEQANAIERASLEFHKLLLDNKLPQTMGGGIGQSRLCMLLLRKCHIGEVQSSVWPHSTRRKCTEADVFLF